MKVIAGGASQRSRNLTPLTVGSAASRGSNSDRRLASEWSDCKRHASWKTPDEIGNGVANQRVEVIEAELIS